MIIIGLGNYWFWVIIGFLVSVGFGSLLVLGNSSFGSLFFCSILILGQYWFWVSIGFGPILVLGHFLLISGDYYFWLIIDFG